MKTKVFTLLSVSYFILLIGLLTTMQAQKAGAPVQQVQYPYDSPTMLLDYDNSNNAIFIGYAAAKQASFSWTRSGSTLTSIVVSANVGTATTSTAHGLAIGNPVIVVGSSTSALNATYRIATVPTSTTFTFTTSGVGNATYTDAGMSMSTTAPRGTAAIWAITCMNYTSTNMIAKQWVNGNAADFHQIWANRATLTCQ